MAKRPVQKIDFSPYGAAIKAARTGQKESRNKVGDEMYLSPRYLANIENKGQIRASKSFLNSCPAITSPWIKSSLGIRQMGNPRRAGSLTPWQIN